MNADDIRKLLDQVARGERSPDDALASLKAQPPFLDLDYATLDHHRELRTGHPEIIYGPGKTPEQVAELAAAIVERSGRMLATRVDAAQAAAVAATVPGAVHDAGARCVSMVPDGERKPGIAIVSAGTADQAVAGEARVTCRFLGQEPAWIADVGVAGVHRLLRRAGELHEARAVIAVAGMEGALASVVGGLVGVPVVAVPTSVGYGAGAGGLAPLLAMLNSCASNVAVVNIDNGVSAAVVASLINR
ncbi:MAG: nickel pincer cofactor biosynthesis protein LarB [Planctomycetota bacterium]|jgi:NCAIR mutase (PurE)-related protein